MFEQETFEGKTLEQKPADAKSFETKVLAQKADRLFVSSTRIRPFDDPKQRRLMISALVLLLVALGFVLYRDRDFWFPDDQVQEADADQPADSAPATATPTTSAPVAANPTPAPAMRSRHHVVADTKAATPVQPASSDSTAATPPPAITASRTVLPPLEVEVVAGDNHKTVRPGNNSVRVDLQPGTAPQHTIEAPVANDTTETAANVTSNAAERVQMSADTAEVVTHPVNPGYPLLARQMKVQGSVILRALISKDGSIQDLHVLSGPRILASAAQDAVRQWRFKPHYVAGEAVETQAKITVNFTISTN